LLYLGGLDLSDDKKKRFLKMLANRDQEAIYESFKRHSLKLQGFSDETIEKKMKDRTAIDPT
jgi:hypothetical protein